MVCAVVCALVCSVMYVLGFSGVRCGVPSEVVVQKNRSAIINRGSSRGPILGAFAKESCRAEAL